MNDEDAFLRKLLENPADDTTRLVYADWLDEQGDPVSVAKSQYLRLTVQLLEPTKPKGTEATLQKLAVGLDTDWLAVVSRLKVEKCAGKKRAASQGKLRLLEFDFVCDKRWDEMAATEQDGVRFCEGCSESVHYCDTIVTARNHAKQGHCIAVDLGIIRHEGDVSSLQMMMLGRLSAAALERVRKRNGVDEVSQAREEAKRKKV